MKLKNVLIIAIAILSLGFIVACSDDVVATKDNNLNAYRVTESNGAFVYNETKYETLQDALDAIEKGKDIVFPEGAKTIKVTRSVTGPVAKVAANQEVVLDLGGNTLTFYGVKDSALTIGSNAKFGIVNGTLTLADKGNEDLAVIGTDGATTIELSGVTISAAGQKTIDAAGVTNIKVLESSSISGATILSGVTSFTAAAGTSVEGTLVADNSSLYVKNNMEAGISMLNTTKLDVADTGHAVISYVDTAGGKTVVATNGDSAITNNSGVALPVETGICYIVRSGISSYYGDLANAVASLDADNLTIVFRANDTTSYGADTLLPQYPVTINLNTYSVSVSLESAYALTVIGSTNTVDEVTYIGTITGSVTAAGVGINGARIIGDVTSKGNMATQKAVITGVVDVTGTLIDGTMSGDGPYSYENGSEFTGTITATGEVILYNSTTKDDVKSLISVSAYKANLGYGEFDDDIHAPIITIVDSTVRLNKLIEGVVVNTDVPADLIHLSNVTGTINEAIVAADSGVDYIANTVSSKAYAFYLRNEFDSQDFDLYIKEITSTGIASTVQAVYISNASPADAYIISNGLSGSSIDATNGDVYVEVAPVSGDGSIVNIIGSVKTTTSGNIELKGKTHEGGKTVAAASVDSAGSVTTHYSEIHGTVRGTTIIDGTVSGTTYSAGSKFHGAITIDGAATFYSSTFKPNESLTSNPVLSAETVGIYGSSFELGGNDAKKSFDVTATKTVDNPEASSADNNLQIIASTGNAGSISTTGSKKVDANTYKSNIVIDNTSLTAVGIHTLGVGAVSATNIANNCFGNVTVKGYFYDPSVDSRVTVASIPYASAVTTQDVIVSGAVGGASSPSAQPVASLTDGTRTGENAPYTYANGSYFTGAITASGAVILYNSTTRDNVTSGDSVSAYKATLGDNSGSADDSIYAPDVSITDGSKISLSTIGKSNSENATSVTITEPEYYVSSYHSYIATIKAVNLDVSATNDKLTVNDDYSSTSGTVSIAGGTFNGNLSLSGPTTISDGIFKEDFTLSGVSSLNSITGGTFGDSFGDKFEYTGTGSLSITGGTFNSASTFEETGLVTVGKAVYTDNVFTSYTGPTFSAGSSFTHLGKSSLSIVGGTFNGTVNLNGEDNTIVSTISGGSSFGSSSIFTYNGRGELDITAGSFDGITNILRGNGYIDGTCSSDSTNTLYFADLNIGVNEWYIRSACLTVNSSSKLNALASKIVQTSGETNKYVYITYSAQPLGDIVFMPTSSILKVNLYFDGNDVSVNTNVKIDSRVTRSGSIGLFDDVYLYSNVMLCTVYKKGYSIEVAPTSTSDPTYPYKYSY